MKVCKVLQRDYSYFAFNLVPVGGEKFARLVIKLPRSIYQITSFSVDT
jgi:hypothetical protein